MNFSYYYDSVSLQFQLELQRMENALAQQRKSGPAVSHTLDEFELVHFALNQAIVLGKSQSRHCGLYLSFAAWRDMCSDLPRRNLPSEFSSSGISRGATSNQYLIR